jgi:putative cardiolipin synthase
MPLNHAIARPSDRRSTGRTSRKLPGACLVPLALACLMALAGCASVSPASAPVQTSAVSPVQDPLWSALEAAWPGDRFEVLNRGDEALEWRLRAIDSATASIDLQTFLWSADGSGLAILARLLAAADRGVRVRILLDDSFTVGEGEAIAALAQHPGIEFRIYNPFAQRPDNLVLRQVANLGDFARVDHRMHNKVMIADTRAAIVGGRNLADEYFGQHASANFRDLEAIASGPIVRQLADVFDRYWQSPWAVQASDVVGTPSAGASLDALRTRLAARVGPLPAETPEARQAAWNELLAGAVPASATVLADDPARADPAVEKPDQLAAALIEQIDLAASELILVSAYLIPTPELAEAIQRAERRGVQVRILTNSLRSNNHTAAHSAYRHYVHTLIRHGADLHEVRALAKDRSRYMRTPVDQKHLGLHAKVLLIDDDLSFVGSANLDPRSLNINTEMGLLVRSREFSQSLRECLGVDFERRNAWHLQESADGQLRWVGDDVVLHEQPAESMLQRLEDWFLGALPIGDKM